MMNTLIIAYDILILRFLLFILDINMLVQRNIRADGHIHVTLRSQFEFMSLHLQN